MVIIDYLEDGMILDQLILVRELVGTKKSFSRISYNPGSTHSGNGCGNKGRKTGIKNTVTLTYHPNKFRAKC